MLFFTVKFQYDKKSFDENFTAEEIIHSIKMILFHRKYQLFSEVYKDGDKYVVPLDIEAKRTLIISGLFGNGRQMMAFANRLMDQTQICVDKTGREYPIGKLRYEDTRQMYRVFEGFEYRSDGSLIATINPIFYISHSVRKDVK